MGKMYNKKSLIDLRKDLRKNQTIAESVLWEALRNRKLDGYKFYRQYSVEIYILDFYCAEQRLGIEVDGGYHQKYMIKHSDKYRDITLCELNIRVLRFNNEEVLQDLNSVLGKISAALPLC